MALRGRNIENFDAISLTAWSRGLPIVFHQPVFKIATSAGLNSLRQKGYQILVKNWVFDDLFNKKRQVLAILVPGMIQPSGSVIVLMK